MLLNGEYAPRVGDGLQDSLAVDGLDGVHVDHAHGEAVRLGKHAGGVHRLQHGDAAADDGQIRASRMVMALPIS